MEEVKIAKLEEQPVCCCCNTTVPDTDVLSVPVCLACKAHRLEHNECMLCGRQKRLEKFQIYFWLQHDLDRKKINHFGSWPTIEGAQVFFKNRFPAETRKVYAGTKICMVEAGVWTLVQLGYYD